MEGGCSSFFATKPTARKPTALAGFSMPTGLTAGASSWTSTRRSIRRVRLPPLPPARCRPPEQPAGAHPSRRDGAAASAMKSGGRSVRDILRWSTGGPGPVRKCPAGEDPKAVPGKVRAHFSSFRRMLVFSAMASSNSVTLRAIVLPLIRSTTVARCGSRTVRFPPLGA
jgi:hypothetical protein